VCSEDGVFCVICRNYYRIIKELPFNLNKYYCESEKPIDIFDLVSHFESQQHKVCLNLEYENKRPDLPIPFPDIKKKVEKFKSLSSSSSSKPSKSSSSHNHSISFVIRHQSLYSPSGSSSSSIISPSRVTKGRGKPLPYSASGLEKTTKLVLIQQCNLILHEGMALRKLKPIMDSFSYSQVVMNGGVEPKFDHMSLQSEIDSAIAEAIRLKRADKIIRSGGAAVSSDGWKDGMLHEMLLSMVQYQDPDNNWEEMYELLGVQRVEGVHVTGEAINIALGKTLDRNHIPKKLVDQLCFDGGANMKGKDNGAAEKFKGEEDTLDDVIVEHCPIHRFIFTVYLVFIH
jgi:hypothetical protein